MVAEHSGDTHAHARLIIITPYYHSLHGFVFTFACNFIHAVVCFHRNRSSSTINRTYHFLTWHTCKCVWSSVSVTIEQITAHTHCSSMSQMVGAAPKSHIEPVVWLREMEGRRCKDEVSSQWRQWIFYLICHRMADNARPQDKTSKPKINFENRKKWKWAFVFLA